MGLTSENRASSLKKLKIAIYTIFSLLIITCMWFTPVFADGTGINTGGDHNNGGGEGSGAGTGGITYGYDQSDGGYRCYMEDKSGNIVLLIVDFYFDFDYYRGIANELPPALQTYWGKEAALGGTAGTRKFRYNETFGGDSGLIPGLRPPFYRFSAWGPNLNAWFESTSNAEGKNGTSNAELFIASVFKQAGDNAVDLLYNYKIGNYRIVVEGIYWFNLLDPVGNRICNSNGDPLYVYGTARDIARYNLTESVPINGVDVPVNNLITKYPERRTGGEQLNAFTNRDFVTAVIFVEDDEFSKFIVPNLPTALNGKYTYETILTDKQGWDMHVIWKERAIEKWATWDSTKYGGYQEASPGPAPKQPEIPGVDNTKIHPVTIIKYYELEKVERDSSGKKKTVYETVTGPTRQTKICTTIDVQTEPGWILRRHFQAKEDVHAAKWLDISSSIKYKQRFGASTVEMEVESGYKYLYVWHVKVDNTPPAPETPDLEMILNESEISRAFETTKVVNNTNPKFQFNWTNPQEWLGFCYEEEVTDYDDPLWLDPEPIKDALGNIIGWTEPEFEGYGTKMEPRDHTTRWIDNVLNLRIKLDELLFNSYKNILGNIDPFKPKLVENGNMSKLVNVSDGTTLTTLENFTSNFTIWRGDDQPTIAQYIASPGDSGAIDSLLDQTSAACRDQGRRKNSTGLTDTKYELNLKLDYIVDKDLGEYLLKTECLNALIKPEHSEEKNGLDFFGNNRTSFTGPVTVYYFNGDPSDPATKIKSPLNDAKNSSGSGLATAGGYVMRLNKKYQNMMFYPYVQMSYQTTADAGTTNGGIVYVLSSYERGLNAGAAARLQFQTKTYPGTGYSMLVRLDQWSTHATALSKYGKNKLLPGGAIYQLTSNGGSGVGQLGVTLTIEAWYPDKMDKFNCGITQVDPDWNGSNGASEFQALMSLAINKITNGAHVEMRVRKGMQSDAISGIVVGPGADLLGIGNSGMEGLSDSKYYLQSSDPGASNSNRVAVSGSGGLNTVVEVEAKPDGKVNISAGGGTIAKDKGIEALPKNSIAYDANDKTSLITNFIASLQRNAGNDKQTTFGNYWAKEDGHWYNELFGAKINYYKGTITIGIPNNDHIGLGGVLAVLDPNVGPAHTGTADKFSNVNTAQFFVVLDDTILGQLSSLTISYPAYPGYIMASQPFYVASYTVQDND